MPQVNIIMPNYNKSEYIDEAIESVLRQSFTNWKLYIIDDFSSDNSFQIINRYKDNKKIKIIKLKKNKGPSFCRNLGMRISTNDFIAFIDSDDYWEEFKLEKQVKKFQENNKIDVLYSNYFTNINQKIEKKTKHLFNGYCQSKIIESYINGSPLTAWLTLMIKKNSIEKLEYSFDNKTHISSDFDLIIRLSNFSNSFLFLKPNLR